MFTFYFEGVQIENEWEDDLDIARVRAQLLANNRRGTVTIRGEGGSREEIDAESWARDNPDALCGECRQSLINHHPDCSRAG